MIKNVFLRHKASPKLGAVLFGALTASSLFNMPRAVADVKGAVPPATPPTAISPKATILETKVISSDPEHYHGWPTLIRRKSGQLVVVYSGGREEHRDPFGRVEMIVSNDEGKTWGRPRVLLDTDIDDRDSGILETARGTLLVTTFTWIGFEEDLAKARDKAAAGAPNAWKPEKFAAWEAAINRLTPEQRKAEVGQWMLRSTDGGFKWEPPAPALVSSPHGPIQLRDGRLLHFGNEQGGEARRGVVESTDDGATWHWLSNIPVRPGDDPKQYWELHGVETDDNRIVCQIRNHNKENAGETLQCESTDGGKTWTMTHPIGVWGLPSHLLKLRNGNLLMTYGHRRAPFGNQARLSKDGGRTWSEAMTLSADGPGIDLGYPSSTELPDGSIISVWYERMTGSDKAVLRQAHWRLS